MLNDASLKSTNIEIVNPTNRYPEYTFTDGILIAANRYSSDYAGFEFVRVRLNNIRNYSIAIGIIENDDFTKFKRITGKVMIWYIP